MWRDSNEGGLSESKMYECESGIDECISLADQSHVSVEKVYRAALTAWERGGDK